MRPLGTAVDELRGGASISADDFTDFGFPVLHKGVIQSGGKLDFARDGKNHVSQEFMKAHPNAVIDDRFVVATFRNLVRSGETLGFIASIPTGAAYLLAQGAYGLKLSPEKINPRYLSHLSNAWIFHKEVLRRMVGTTQVHIRNGDFLGIEVPMPPLSEQRRIAEVLDRAEALRANRRVALAQLDSLTQAIFIEMFGDPVANERGWPVVSVSEFVAGFESGKSVVADDVDDMSCPYRVLKVSAVTSLEYLPGESKALPFDYKPPASHFVHKGDLLFSRANTSELIGATALVHDTPPNILMPDKLWRFVWHEASRAEPRYVLYLFQRPKFRSEIAKRATGTSGSMKNIAQEKVLSMRVGHPPLSLQREFSQRIVAVENLKASQRASLAQLDTLFNSLQHRAFRGEL